jgi:1-acyl-sn-glycerol-3-phosphate acyltransferase
LETLKRIAVRIFYWTATYVLRFVLMVVGRWKVNGREHLPREGGVILVSNHLSNADPPILGAAVARRRVRFMAKQELFKYPFGIVPRLYGAFPVKRFEADLGALMNAERLLKRGEILGMFPEGTRTRTGVIGKPHPGTALIAIRSGVPVVCCSLSGTEALRKPLNLLKKPRITVTLSEPITFEQQKRPTPEAIEAATKAIFDRIIDGLPDEYHRTYTRREERADGDDSAGQ